MQNNTTRICDLRSSDVAALAVIHTEQSYGGDILLYLREASHLLVETIIYTIVVYLGNLADKHRAALSPEAVIAAREAELCSVRA